MLSAPARPSLLALPLPKWVHVVALALMTSGCAQATADRAGDAFEDAGATSDPDSHAPDQGVSADPGAPSGAENTAGLAESCFVDQAACTADIACQSLRSCCVGDGACVDAVTPAPLPALMNWSTCASVASCLQESGTSGYVFGSPGARITEGALEGGGDDSFDSGVILGEEIDLRYQRVSLSAQFQLPEDCTGGCREAVALGVTAQPPAEAMAEAHVPMLAAIVLSGATRTARLLIRDNAVALWSVATDTAMTLSIVPSGRVEALVNGEVVATGELGVADAARVVIMGHSRNPLAGRRNAGLTESSFSVVAADFPDRYSSRGPIDLVAPFAEPFDPRRVTRPTGIVTRDGRGLIAFVEGEHIFVAAQSTTDGQRFGLLTSTQMPTIAGSGPIDSACLLQPVESASETPPVYLYFSGGAEGARRVVLSDDGVAGAEEALMVIDGALSSALTTDRFRHFHVTQHFNGDFVMVALDDEYGGLQFFRSDDGLTFTALPRTSSTADLAIPALGDEVAWPSLSIHNGAWHLFLSVREGTRYRTHLFLSDDLQHFRHFGPVLMAEGAGFERLGVLSASPILRPVDVRTGTEGGAMTPTADGSFGTQTLEMLYVGDDGTRKRLGRAVRTAPTYGRWQS